MSRTSTDPKPRSCRPAFGCALAAAALLLSGCGSAPTREGPARADSGPDPAALSAYEQALADVQAGNDAEAEKKLSALVEKYPDYSGPLVNLGLLHARRDDSQRAAALLQRATAVCGRCAAAWNELGVVQRRQGLFADAERSYLQAIAADPADANAHFNLGVLYEIYLQRPELALDAYTRYRGLAVEGEAGDVDKWMADLARRVKAVERSAQVEDIL